MESSHGSRSRSGTKKGPLLSDSGRRMVNSDIVHFYHLKAETSQRVVISFSKYSSRRNPCKIEMILLMVQKSSDHQLRLVVCLIIQGFYTSQVVQKFFHQQ